LFTGWTASNGNVTSIAFLAERVRPNVIASLSISRRPSTSVLNTLMAAPEVDAVGIADAIQDAEQDEG
jgi:hypothetical protein